MIIFIYTNNLITSAGGTWFTELNNNFSLTRDAFGYGLFLNTLNNVSKPAYEELAKTNDSQKFMLKVYECMLIKNPAFCASITEISA